MTLGANLTAMRSDHPDTRPSAHGRRLLVVYASKHGATREIAETIGEQLRTHGLEPTVAGATDAPAPDGFAGIVVGSAVYMGHWRREARRYLGQHRDALRNRPLWIFTSGPIDASDEADHTPAKIRALVDDVGARDHVTFHGRLPDKPGNFVERSMVSATPEDKRDARDWPAIRAWAHSIAVELGAPRAEPLSAR